MEIRMSGTQAFLSVGLSLLSGTCVYASDHADPIDPLNLVQQEGGITDLFVFPVLKDQSPAFSYDGNMTAPLEGDLASLARTPLTAEQIAQIDSLVVILCVRRALTDHGTLMLEPYTYRVHIDTNHPITFAQTDEPGSADTAAGSSGYDDGHSHGPDVAGGRPTPHEAFLRYGGMIEHPEKIREEIIIEFGLTDRAAFKVGFPRYLNSKSTPIRGWSSQTIQESSGVFDDPFIFHAFFGTDVVAMAVRIPINRFDGSPKDFLIWATSHKGGTQIDHQGRSLRTQNPRFELLNTLHPKDHVKAIVSEHTNPGLLRDIALRLNFAQTFAYRKWDFTPDVMIYTTQYPAGFPNGRLLTDDVAALLAQWGDTLLFELSHQHNNAKWPRQQTNDRNDGKFKATFPYLLDPLAPNQQKEQAPPPQLSAASRWKLVGIVLAILALLVVENTFVVWWWCKRKHKRMVI